MYDLIDRAALLKDWEGRDAGHIPIGAIESVQSVDATPVVYASETVQLHHYFEDEEFGDLIFYADVYCSNCGKKFGELRLDTVDNPCEFYDDEWDINPESYYPDEIKKARQILSKSSRHYCSNCGAKFRRGDLGA